MSSTKLKPLYLMDIFRELTDEEHRLTVPDLVEELARRGVKAERKGLYRDIEALVEYGADIRKSGTGYYLGKREFTLAELRVLSSAVQAAGFISQRRTEELTGKIASLAGRRAKCLTGCNIGGVKCGNDEVINLIGIVDQAITEHRQITFAYYKWDISRREVAQRSGSRYRVSPYALIWMQDKYYMVANMEGRDDLTHFRLDRMRKVRPDGAPWRHFGEVSEYKLEFRASEYASKCLNMFGGETARIRIRCHGSVVNEVLDRFGENTAIIREGDNHFSAVVESSVGQGFIAWASQFGDRVEILSPPKLRDDMKNSLKAALEAYI